MFQQIFNAISHFHDLFIFCKDDPHFFLNLPEDVSSVESGGKLVIFLEYRAFGRDCLNIVIAGQQAEQEKAQDTSCSTMEEIPAAAPEVPLSWWSVNKSLIKLRLKSLKYYLFNEHYRTIKKSGLFDPVFYLQNDSRMDPLRI